MRLWPMLFVLLADTNTLVDAASVVPGLRLDLRYATSRNVVGRPLYRQARCLLLPAVAAALGRAQAELAKAGYGLLAWDCYRPLSAQRALWEKQPTPGLVADPKRGSNHNRGAAVDLTLVTLDGAPVEMPTDFDNFSPRAARDATDGVSPTAQKNRELLRSALRAQGFTTIRKEWWHFDYSGALALPLLDVPL